MNKIVFIYLASGILSGCVIQENKNFLVDKALPAPSISIVAGTNETLTNTSITLRAVSSESDVSYQWSLSGIGLLDTLSSQQVVYSSLSQEGQAVIHCKVNKSGRSESAAASQIIDVLLSMGQLQKPVISFPNGTNVVGTNDSLQLGASGSISGSAYNWSILAGNGSISPTGELVTFNASNIIERVTVICHASKATYSDSASATNYIDVVRSYLTFTNNLILWLDADDTNTIVLRGGADPTNVYQWRDKSGLSNHTLDVIPAYEPFYRTNVRNGLAAVYFDGAARYFREFLYIPPYTANVLTVICVFSHTNIGLTSPTLWQTRTNTTTTWAGFTPWAGAGTGTTYLGTNLTTGYVSKAPASFKTNSWYIASVVYGASSIQLYQDGVYTNGCASSLPANYHNYLQIGRRMGGGANNFYRGHLGEILIYSTALTPSERLSVERYLSKKWGIPVP
jgi:hypothetical protein